MNEKRVEIEIAGHKGYIDTVKGLVGDGGLFGPREDRLMVVISFDQAVESILAFPVYLPAVPYRKEGFLDALKPVAEKVLEGLLSGEREKRAKEARREARQSALDGIAAGVKAAIGLEEE